MRSRLTRLCVRILTAMQLEHSVFVAGAKSVADRIANGAKLTALAIDLKRRKCGSLVILGESAI